MVLNITQKEQIVCEIRENLRSSSCVVVASLDRVKSNLMNQLRKEARNLGIYVKVVANSLLKRAIETTPCESLLSVFVGQNIIAFSTQSTGDVVRIFTKFSSNDNNYFKITAAIIEGNFLSADHIDLLSNLPDQKESILKLIYVLKTLSIGNLINALKCLSNQKVKL